jgi:chemotaxis response regulator CheB
VSCAWMRPNGSWPGQARTFQTTTTITTSTPAATEKKTPPQHLPLLRELVRNCGDAGLTFAVAQGFMDARPLVLRIPYASLIRTVDGLATPSSTTNTDAENRAAAGILSRVRNLALVGSIRDGPSGLARVLRAAPKLEALPAAHMNGDFLSSRTHPKGSQGARSPAAAFHRCLGLGGVGQHSCRR